MRLYRYSDPEPTTICSGETERPRRRYRVPAMASPQLRDPAVGHGTQEIWTTLGQYLPHQLGPDREGERALCSRRLPRRSIIQGCPGGGASVRMGGGDGGRRAGSSWETK